MNQGLRTRKATSHNLGISRLWARGFAAVWAALALTVVLSVGPAKAVPFAYITNYVANNVSVIDTATNIVVATVAVGDLPVGIAVTPDGSHVYVANSLPNSVSVIDTATNTVVASVSVGGQPTGVAVTPDGKHTYVTDLGSNSVSVIDTATNTVVATVAVGSSPYGVAVHPDGKHAYVTNAGSGTVSVIDTATNTVVATVAVGSFPYGVAVHPDGKHAYVTNAGSGTVSVIDTATNTVVATVAVGEFPSGVAVTPDGRHSYVANQISNTVSVIDTGTNTVVATVGGQNRPVAVGIIPPPLGIPFGAFSAKLEIHFGKSPNTEHLNFNANLILGSASNGINPPAEPVTIKVGTFTITIPPGSFDGTGFGPFQFEGVIDGVRLVVLIQPTGATRYSFHAVAHNANLTGTTNPVPVTLTIGDDSGTTTVKANISPKGGQAQM